MTHVRAGRIEWRLFWWMAPPSMVGAVAGGFVSGELPGNALLIAIGVVLLGFGLDLLRPRHVGAPAQAGQARAGAAVAAGLVIGVLGGFVGLILGALRLPALIRFVGVDAFRAVGTNAAVGFCLGVAGVFGHLNGGVDWTLLWVGAVSSVPGSILGARLTGRLDERQLLRAVGVVLVAAGVSLILEGAI